MPSGLHRRLRASDAERERAAEALRRAAVEGRLDSEEFETRVGQVYAARWTAELAPLTADVEPPEPLAHAGPHPGQGAHPVRPHYAEVVIGWVTVFVFFPVALVLGIRLMRTEERNHGIAITACTAAMLGVMVLAGVVDASPA